MPTPITRWRISAVYFAPRGEPLIREAEVSTLDEMHAWLSDGPSQLALMDVYFNMICSPAAVEMLSAEEVARYKLMEAA